MKKQLVNPIKRTELVRSVVQSIAQVPDELKRTVYIQESAGRLGMQADDLLAELSRQARSRMEQEAKAPLPSLQPKTQGPIGKPQLVGKVGRKGREQDFALLGCNAKLIWHELFLQIVDIISMSNIKYGIILCKNFHTIHTELLPIFYSYMQQYNNSFLPFQIRYILISEQVSFIPNNVMNLVKTVNVKRPNDDIYYDYLKVPRDIDKSFVLNLKESKLLNLVKEDQEVPDEIFDIICGEIKKKMDNFKKTTLSEFREQIYDILVYNLDFVEVLWEILSQYVQEDVIKSSDLEQIIEPIYGQIKQYNNNYRPIYHLENILLNIVKIKDGY